MNDKEVAKVPQDILDRANELYPEVLVNYTGCLFDDNAIDRGNYVKGALDERKSMFEFMEWTSKEGYDLDTNGFWIRYHCEDEEPIFLTLQHIYERWNSSK